MPRTLRLAWSASGKSTQQSASRMSSAHGPAFPALRASLARGSRVARARFNPLSPRADRRPDARSQVRAPSTSSARAKRVRLALPSPRSRSEAHRTRRCGCWGGLPLGHPNNNRRERVPARRPQAPPPRRRARYERSRGKRPLRRHSLARRLQPPRIRVDQGRQHRYARIVRGARSVPSSTVITAAVWARGSCEMPLVADRRDGRNPRSLRSGRRQISRP
jgi:hypothetical protein